MSTRVQAVRELQETLQLLKKAFMQLPPHPDFAPQQPPADPAMMQGAPPAGGPADPAMMQGAPPPGGPVDPAMMQGAPPPGDPAAQGMPPQAPPVPQEPPAVPAEMAAIMDQVVHKVEQLNQANVAQAQAYDARISKLEQELVMEKRVKDERRKVIDALVPANL